VNARPYNDINSTFTFEVLYRDSAGNALTGNSTNVNITFQNTTANMTFDAAHGWWIISITANSTQDVPITINATNTNFKCQVTSFTTKFRTPFFITFKLYKNPLNATDPAQYTDEFQFVVLTDLNHAVPLSSALYTINSYTGSFASSLVTWTGAPALVLPNSTDPNTYFWGNYVNGAAVVKLYEPSNYSVYVMNNKVSYSLNQFWEFQRPTDGTPSYLGNVLSSVALYNTTSLNDTPTTFNNTIIKVSLTPFEANPVATVTKWFYITIIVIFYIVIMIIVFIAASGTPGGIQIALYIAFALGAAAIGIIWSL
jgi:hypothetical protein